MKKATQTRGLPIMDIAQGVTVGHVDKLIIDPAVKAVVYFTLSDNTVVRLADCVGIGGDCVVIRSGDAIRKIYDNRDIAEMMDKGRDITGIKVMADSGNVIGEVVDFVYELRTGKLVNVTFNTGAEAEASRVLSINRNLMFVMAGDEAAPAMEESMDDDDAYLLGKAVNADVKSDDGSFTLKAGEVITEEVLKQAKAANALLQLALVVD